MLPESERKVLEKLMAAQHAVQHKYKLLKRGQLESDRLLHQTFTPISEPLKKLVNMQIKKDVDVKPEVFSNEARTTVTKKEEDDSQQFKINDSILYDSDVYDTADDDDDLQNKTIVSPHDYVLKNDDSVDRVYGVRKTNGLLKVGGSEVVFTKDYLVDKTNGLKYPLTHGFVELLVKKQPDFKLVTEHDKIQYTNLLESTNPHRIGYSPQGTLKQTNAVNKKWINVINPMLTKKKLNLSTSGMGLPKYKVARPRANLIDLVYYDDPNEIIERLKLLIAEQQAGNDAHTNEIHSILEELREGGYIL